MLFGTIFTATKFYLNIYMKRIGIHIAQKTVEKHSSL
jgi:hypothetical protein